MRSAPEGPGIPPSPEGRRVRTFPWRKLVDAAVILLAAFAAAMLLRMFVFEVFRIPSHSMEPSLLAGDLVVVSKLPSGGPRVGEVLAFRSPASGDAQREGAVFLKRCVAEPGDSVVVEDGAIRVNGREEGITASAGGVAVGGGGKLAGLRRTWVIPRPGESIALNDSTLPLWHSLIEREGHRVAAEPSGGVLLDGAPASFYRVERRHYFVAGDNAADSYDSRYWGLVPETAILGKAILIYWSWDVVHSAVRWGRLGMLVR